MNKSSILLSAVIGIALTTIVGASERICSDQTPSQQQRSIVRDLLNLSADDYVGVAQTDINRDGKKDLFYSLQGGSCGQPVGILLNLGNGKWKKILNEGCYGECWSLLDSSSNGFIDVLQLNDNSIKNNPSKTKCTYNTSKGKYGCKR